MYRVASLLAIGLLNAPAQAGQIVSNLTEPYNFGAGLGGVWVEASSFTTDAQSYFLNSVTLDLQVNSAGTVALSLFNDSGGLPGTSLENLGTQFINANGGDYDTAYPASGATLLQANTRYWLVVEQVGAGSIQWVSTFSTAETSPGGVTIGNDMYYRSVGGTTWTAQAGATDTGQFAVDATSSGPPGVPAILIADQERTAVGTLFNKFFNGADGGPASTATWTWNGSLLTQTGGTFYTTRHISNVPAGASIETDEIVGLVINTGGSSVTAASFLCNEGTFGPAVQGKFCGLFSFGNNSFSETYVEYIHGGNANCIYRVIGGDDVDGGPVRGLSTHGAVGNCAAQAGIYERYTVSMVGGNLILSNGVPINTNGSIWMTFGLDSDSDGILDSTDNCILRANPTQCDSDSDGYGNRCDGDFGNPVPGNGATNAQDFILFRTQLFQPSVPPTYNKADINCNGIVNSQDHALFRTLLNAPPGPSGLMP